MGRFRRPRPPQAYQQGVPHTLLSSAALIKQSQLRSVPEMRPWQEQAWSYYDLVGELRFAAQWVANALSRCRLYVGVPSEESGVPVPLDDTEAPDARAQIPLDELFGGGPGHSEMLSKLGLLLTVPGEGFLIGFDDVETGDRRWLVASSEEFSRNSAKQFRIRLPESDRQVPISVDNSTVIRLWRPHPRRAWEADSPVRAALSVLKELVDLSAHVSATVESRLAGAGLLLLPESATLPAPMSAQGEPLHEDPAMATLIDAMITPLGDRDSAAAVVPILVRIPDQAVGKTEYIRFSTPLDEKVQQLREASIRRFATIVDIPAEVLTGTADVNHWGMWKIEESAIKLHIAPLLGLICDALTTKYLWPALEATGVATPENYVIWYDDAELTQRPNRGPESQNLYEHTLLKGSTVRRSNGFTEDDAPTLEEQRRILLNQLAGKGIDPRVVAPYLSALGIELDLSLAVPLDAPALDSSVPPGSRVIGRPTLPTRLPTRPDPLPADPDKIDRVASAGLAVASVRPVGRLDVALVEYAAMRALELAGKRALNNSNREWKGKLRRVHPWEIHTHIKVTDPDFALEGAYDLLEQCLPDEPCVRHVIDGYVRDCLDRQVLHDRDHLLSLLATAGCLAPGGGSRAIA